MSRSVTEFADGVVVCADSTLQATVDFVRELTNNVGLIVCDPPYGNVLRDEWDRVKVTDVEFAQWMCDWTNLWRQALLPGGAFYVWGGVGRVGFRPFFKYVTLVEQKSQFELSNLVTWSKRRAYGTKNNYLFTREELAFFVNGSAKRPRVFNVPLLDKERGYAGYNKKYPAKSKYYRRTNVWTDVNEIFRGKVHVAQKPRRVIEIPIEVHTSCGEYVIDPFAGSGTTALAARALGRKFVVIDSDHSSYELICSQL